MKFYDVPAHVVSPETDNITSLLLDRISQTPDIPLMSIQDAAGNWADMTASEFRDDVEAVAKGLIASGIQPGQAVAIMSRTRYEWTLIDFAIWYAGAVSVPIYETSAPTQIEWILADSDAVALFVERSELAQRYEQIKSGTPLVRQVWNIGDGDVNKLKELGREVTAETLEGRRTSAKLGDLATIIYTSGTTGRPKGCELTHRGFVELSRNTQIELPDVLKAGYSTLMFLPLAHVFARFVSVLCVYGGVKMGFQPDAKNIASSLPSFKPTFLLAVPRVFEKVYNSAEQKAEAGGKGKIFRKAAHIATEYSRALDTKKGPSIGLKAQFKVFDALVYKKLRAAMGGNVKFAISGGAPLGERLGHFYRAIGLTVLEGYGLTETTAPALIGRTHDLKIGKVGRPLPGTGVQISADGEVWLRGNNLLRGYWRNPEATRAAFEDGWFKTGDVGELDEDGFLSITGRKKELLITAGGKNVAPAPLEDPIRANPLVGQVVAIGDNRPFVSALISLDAEMLPIWMANNGGDSKLTLAEAAKSPLVLSELQRAIDEVNTHFSNAEQIRKFAVLDSELTEDSGHLTPSMKIKREIVARDFASVIDGIYQGS